MQMMGEYTISQRMLAPPVRPAFVPEDAPVVMIVKSSTARRITLAADTEHTPDGTVFFRARVLLDESAQAVECADNARVGWLVGGAFVEMAG